MTRSDRGALFEGTPGLTQVIFELVSADGTVAKAGFATER